MALVKLKLRTGILRLKKRTRDLLPQFILGTHSSWVPARYPFRPVLDYICGTDEASVGEPEPVTKLRLRAVGGTVVAK